MIPLPWLIVQCVYAVGVVVAWVLITRSHYRRFGSDGGDLIEGVLVSFFPALIWPLLLPAYAVAIVARRLA